MSRLRNLLRSFGSQPGYTLMRGVARFENVRGLVAGSRRVLHGPRLRHLLRDAEARMTESQFADLDREEFLDRLRHDGVAHGLTLPAQTVADIRAWAQLEPCYADRDQRHGFKLAQRADAEAKLGKPILLAQYFNAATQCPAIARLAADPALQWIAARYLQSVPTFVGANLWWTFPVKALEADRDRHAHLFHRDVDDFRFFKFFFYLTDVPAGEGAHVCVVASHRDPPRLRASDRWNIRRYRDEEIEATYPPDRVHEICGDAGTGFAENTLCVHKGSTPSSEARLLLQLQYALFDYGAMHDRRHADALRTLA
jgi:hypothetical protein